MKLVKWINCLKKTNFFELKMCLYFSGKIKCFILDMSDRDFQHTRHYSAKINKTFVMHDRVLNMALMNFL